MNPIKHKSWIITGLLFFLLALTVATSTASDVGAQQNDRISLTNVLYSFIQFTGLAGESLSLAGSADFPGLLISQNEKQPEVTIEMADSYTRVSGADNISISAVRLKEKPPGIKEPHFKLIQYLEIHQDTSSNLSASIRIFNEWQRPDLMIYHYKDNEWHALPTIVNGDFLEAVTGSFSVFAVGASGGINLRLLADTLILPDDTLVVAGAAYYNNSTAASGISIQINPSWTGSMNTTADAQGNFIAEISGPVVTGNYSIIVNATSVSLFGSNSTIVQVTNAALYRTNATAVITGNKIVDPFAGINFSFPEDAVPETSGINFSTDSTTDLVIKVNNITVYNATTNIARLNLTGYIDRQNDINITSGGQVNITYAINLGFHTAGIANIAGNYSTQLNVTNGMDYDWENSSIIYHISEGAQSVSVWENSSNITGSAVISGDLLRIKNSGIGTLYNNSARRFTVNYSLVQLQLNISTDREELNEGVSVSIIPYVSFNGTAIDTPVRMTIYRDSLPVYDMNVSSGNPVYYSNTIAGVYNITASSSMNIDGVERTGWNRTFIHIKDLLLYAAADPAMPGRNIRITGRAYYTNGTGHEGRINITIGNGSFNATSNATGYFSYYIPGREAGTYPISLNASSGNSITYANSNATVHEKYFYLVKGDLPVISGDVTLAPDAALWVNNTNITGASLYLYCKTAIHLLYDPLPIAHKLIPTSLNSNISGTFNLPLYPYDYLEILSALLITTAEDPANTVQDMAFNVTIDGREVNSSIIPHGDMYFTQTDDIKGFIPSFLSPGNTQTVKVFNKNTGSTQQYYFTEELFVDYIGHISHPCDLFINVNNNFTYANIGNFTNDTVDITGFRDPNNLIRINNCRRTSIIGYNMTLQKQYFGYTGHSVVEGLSKYNITDTALFTPGTNLTSATIIMPILPQARDVSVYVNGTDVTESAVLGENIELFIPDINSSKVINITYWTPILDITPFVNNTQFNRGDAAQIAADITYFGVNVTDALVYASVTKSGFAVANLTLNHTYEGTYLADYVISSLAEPGIYNVTIWAYNATTSLDSENTSFRVRGLNVTVNTGGPYTVDTNASITGYLKDLENNTNISGASVNITIWNSTFSNNTVKITNTTGYYNLSRPVDNAGYYNVTVTALDGNVRGTIDTTYMVKYRVTIPLAPSYNRNGSVAINISVYDRSLVPVADAAVSSSISVGGANYIFSGTTDGNGTYNIFFDNTSTMGYYNVTVNVTKAGVIGNATGSFRVSSLSITEFTDRIEYNAGEKVTVNGTVRDNEVDKYVTSGTYNISIYSSQGFATSRQGNISYPVNTSGSSLWDEDTFETAAEWSGRDYYTPVRDSSTAFLGSYSLRMNWPGTAGWGGRNFEGSTGLETGQTSAGYSTDTYPYMSIAYKISSGDIINMLILVNGAWKSVALTQGSNTGGSYPTVATWGTLITDDKWHWTQINLDEQLDASLGTGNHQITGVIWYPNTIIGSSLTGEFWIDEFRISNKPLSLVSYNETFSGLPAKAYTAYVNVTYGNITGSNSTTFDINYNVNTSVSKTIYAIGEVIPLNITVFDTNNIPVNSEVSINITKPDAGVEKLNGASVNGYFNTSFLNATMEGDYIIAVYAQNASTQAHGIALNRSIRASGFTVNAGTDRRPALYRPGETVNISGTLSDTLGSPRTANVVIRIFNYSGEVANATLPGRNASFVWNHTLSWVSTAGLYEVIVNATTQEGVSSSAAAQFEVLLNIAVSAAAQYNPGDEVRAEISVSNGSVPEEHTVSMAVQELDLWDEFTGTYFDTNRMNASSPDYDTGYYLNFTQNNELIFYTANLTMNDTWVGKAVQLNTTSLGSHFILDYEVSATGTSSQLIARPTIGNSTNNVMFNFRNYSDDAFDGYIVSINGIQQHSKVETTNDRKVRLSIEYDAGTIRFYKNGEQFFQSEFILPLNSAIKLNGYALNPAKGSTAYIKFDNVTLYDVGSPVLYQGTAGGSSGSYTFNFTAGTIGMYRINATSGNSSSYTTFKVRTLNVSSAVYGPYNFNETTLSNNTVIPLIVHGTVSDTETRAGITGALVNITVLQDGIPLAYRTASSNSGSFVLNFAGSLNSTAVGIFNVTTDTNDSGILATKDTSFRAFSINESWADPYMDYRVPILLYNDSGLAGRWQFNEGTGIKIADSSGNGNTGMLYGASVANPGFETMNSGWGSGVENLVFDNTRSRTGVFSGKIVKPTAGELLQFSSNNADNNAGTSLPSSSTQYRYGGCIYIEGGASAEIFFFSWNSSGGARYDGTYDAISTSAQNQWVCINGTTANVVSGDNLFAIRLDNNGGGTVWFDDIWANPVDPWTSGKFGSALQFDGMNDYVQIDPGPSLNFSYATYSMWLKAGPWIQQWSGSNITVPLFQGTWANGTSFWITNDPVPNFSARIYVNRTIYDSAPIPIDRNSYHMLTMSFNGTSFKVYLDGMLRYQNSSVTGVLDPSIFSNPLIIGAAINSGWRDFSGSIDEVSIYDHALSDSEIEEIYNSSSIAYNYDTGKVTFDLALPGGTSGSIPVLYDIERNQQPATIVDMGSYVNVSFESTLSSYEGKILYLYFERPAPVAPDNAAMSSLTAPYSVADGAVEGYRLTISPDKNVYSAGETVALTSGLRTLTGDPIVADIITTIYYPNGTAAQVNYTRTDISGNTLVNFSIPLLKGSFTAITQAAAYGIMRKESTSFSVGDLEVLITPDRAVYNTPDTAYINVKVLENDSITASDLTLKIYDPNGVRVFEGTANSGSYWTDTSDADFKSGTLSNVNVTGGNVILATQGSRYYLSGSLTSKVYDGASSTDWGKLSWSAILHPSDNIVLYTRISQNNITWSDWIPGVYNGDIWNGSRYIQYRANLSTSDDTKTPTLEDVTIETAVPVNFVYAFSGSLTGSYTVTASASKSSNAGYNSTVIELDRFDISALTERPVYTSGGNIIISGNTTYRGGMADANVNLTVKKNLAINPSFETDLDGNTVPDGWIYAWNGTGSRDFVPRTGSYSMKVSRSQSDTIEGLWYYPNMYVIAPNTSYTFSVWVKTDNIVDGNVRLWVYWYNGTTPLSQAINATSPINAQDGWTEMRGSTMSPGNANNVRVHLVSNIVGNVWFDDVNIEPENNPSVYTSSTTSNTYYSFNFSLDKPGSYIVYLNGSFIANGTLNASASTMFAVRNLDVNASAGGSFSQGSGNITIKGYAADNRTKMAASNATVNISITYPDGSSKQYFSAANSTGYYNYTVNTPGLAGTYIVNITAKDYQDVRGTTSTIFSIELGPALYTAAEYINTGTVQELTLEVFSDTRTDSFESNSTVWSYRAGTDGTIRNTSTLRHRSGERSLKVDYDLAAGNEYMFLESGMGAVNVSDNRYITFWLYIPAPDAFNAVALVLENDATGGSSDERIYGQDPVPGWNYYSFNVSTLGKDLSHNHYLTVLIDDDNGTGEVTGNGSLYIDDFRLIRGMPVTGAEITINITKPDMTIETFSTPSGIIERGGGKYAMNFTNTSLYGTYSARAAVSGTTLIGNASTVFGADDLVVRSGTGGPYIIGDELKISGNVSYTVNDAAFHGNVSVNLSYPNGTSKYYYPATSPASQSHTQSGTYGHSGFTNPQNINDGSTTSLAYTSSAPGKYIQVTWPENRTISRVKVYYYNQYWPTAYKIQVLDSDGITWVDKKVVAGYVANPITYPTIEDRIPPTITKGLRIYYQASYYSSYIYIYEIWGYGPEEYSIDKITLPLPGNYTLNITALDSYGVKGMAQSPDIPVGFRVFTRLDKISYEPRASVMAYIMAFNGSGYEPGVIVTSQLTYAANGSVIDTRVTAANSTGVANVSFTIPSGYTSFNINSSVSKNGITGTTSSLITTSNLRIWTDKGEVQIGGSAWAESSAPEEYRNITIKVAALNTEGIRRTGQDLTARIRYPNGSLYGTYELTENDKIYSGFVLFPGKNIPEGSYDIELAEYPGIKSSISVMVWGCVRCHKPNSVSYHYVSHNDISIAPSTFDINHSHRSLVYDGCGGGGCHNSYSTNCRDCHTFEGTTNPPTKCLTCHNSGINTTHGYLNDASGMDLHVNINNTPGGQWYGKDTPCQSCHGTLNSTEKPRIPQCTNCHPNSSGSGMQTMPGNLSGYSVMLEDYEVVDDVTATSGYRYSTVSITTDANNYGGSYSGKVDYGFGSGYGRIYLDKKNLDLTNATKISLWVYGDNSGSLLSISVNNTKSSKISWHQSSPLRIDWIGWRKISVNIHELSQADLMYISAADTVRIKLESDSETGFSGTIFIDDLKKEAVGSHTQYDEVECGVCHGGRHDLKKAPGCQNCHQTQEHGWPAEDKYPGNDSTCMACHQAGVIENRINISNINEHTEILEDFENTLVYTTSLTNFNRSDEYYNGQLKDDGNHSARLDYSGLTGNLGNSINATNAGKFKGISVFVNASNDPGTNLVLGVYTTKWTNYTIIMDWNGWREINVLYHNITVNESTSFNATGTPSRIWLGVYGTNSTGTVYFDDLRQAVSDDYHQYESWICSDCHIQIKNLAGITDMNSPITDCSLCHNMNEPHYKQFSRVCMDCHFDSRHGEVENGNFTKYEKASTCLKCHTVPHDFTQTHLETADCNQCHQQRIHGQNYQSVQYNRSLHLDCERCHGKTTAEAPLPMGLGSPRTTILRLSYTYNNETQCLYCHKDRIVAYDLHINTTVNRSNQTLVESIQNDTICDDCHGAKSLLNASDRDELTSVDAKREPHAPQIDGHGNVSCYKCHGHRPETLTLNYGSNCVGCHQNKDELTDLIPGTTNDSRLSNVTNPGSYQLIVHPPQITGHGNASCSICHGHINSNLTYIGSAASDCANCHENNSNIDSLLPYRQPNSTRSTITNPGGNPLYVIPPQVLGHGNTSCKECHEHAPSTFNGFDFIEGTVCENCHQNYSRNVSLIEHTIPNSKRTKLIDNDTVVSPQVAGHGLTACSECHSHSAERMVYYGGNNTDCVFCHFNESSKETLLRNGSAVISTQITPHQDMNCTECHGHTPSNMTKINDCRLCHQNSTMAQSLSDKYGAGLNMTSPGNNISAIQVHPLDHSNSAIAGQKWNKTAAYWVNGSDSCQYCHAISRNYSDHDPLGRVSAIEGNNTRNSSLEDSYWCASCHYQGYSSGNVTYNDMVKIFLEAGLPVPPEITANSSYGNYVSSNDGMKYYDHGLSDYSDHSCSYCHGYATNTIEFLHGVTEGTSGTDCTGCHTSVTNPDLGMHSRFNGTSEIDNGDCTSCHHDSSMPMVKGAVNNTNTYFCSDCHTTAGTAPVEKKSYIRFTDKRHGENTCMDCHAADGKYHQDNPRGSVSNSTYISRYTIGSTNATDCADCHYAANLDDSPFNAPGGGKHIADNGGACATGGGCHPAGTNMTQTVHNIGAMDLSLKPAISVPTLSSSSVNRGTDVSVTAMVNFTGVYAFVDGAQYRIMSGTTEVRSWTPMLALDGNFNGSSEVSIAVINTDIAPGTYTIEVRGMAGGPAQNTSMRYYPINGDVSMVNATTMIVQPPTGFINGTVIDNVTKAGIPHAKVSTNTSVAVTANDTGFYSIRIAAGSYQLIATGDPEYYANSSTSANVMSNATAAQEIELGKKPTGTISGMVKNT